MYVKDKNVLSIWSISSETFTRVYSDRDVSAINSHETENIGQNCKRMFPTANNILR